MIDEKLYSRIVDFLKENLKETRLIHTFNVVDESIKLAEKYGIDPDRAELAALFHDMYRNLSMPVLDMFIRQLELPKRYKGNPNLAHSKIAASIMKSVYGIDDMEMINAVSFHTTGRANMSLLEKIVFLADAIEPGRSYPGVDRIRELAYENIDDACIASLEGTIQFLKSRDAYIDKDTIDALEFLKEK